MTLPQLEPIHCDIRGDKITDTYLYLRGSFQIEGFGQCRNGTVRGPQEYFARGPFHAYNRCTNLDKNNEINGRATVLEQLEGSTMVEKHFQIGTNMKQVNAQNQGIFLHLRALILVRVLISLPFSIDLASSFSMKRMDTSSNLS